MEINQSIHNFLEDVKKGNNKSVCFITPVGKIKGKLDDYDTSNGTVTILTPTFSDLVIGTKFTVLIETIQAWGQ